MIKTYNQLNVIPLHIDDYKKEIADRLQRIVTTNDQITTSADGYEVNHTHTDKAILDIDHYLEDVHTYYKNRVAEDPYITEAYLILGDYLKIN